MRRGAFGDGPSPRVRAFVVVLGGRSVYERYSPFLMDGPETLFPSFSIAKSVTATPSSGQERDRH